MNEDLKSIWNDLTYTVQKKSDRIREMKKLLDAKNSNYLPSFSLLSAGALFGLYLIPTGVKYMNSVIPVSAFEQIRLRPIHYFDVAILLFALTCIGYWYLETLEVKRMKSKYESQRKDLIQIINHKFCKHDMACDCKDTFIKGMESENIDLIFD